MFIRRRRKDLRELYGDTATVNDQPVRFPDPVLDNIEYRLDRVYAKAGSFQEMYRLMSEHKAWRYRAVDYLLPAAQGKPEYQDILRARNRIAGLMRALLFKRLESSVAAFRSTLNALITKQPQFPRGAGDGICPHWADCRPDARGFVLRRRRTARISGARGGTQAPARKPERQDGPTPSQTSTFPGGSMIWTPTTTSLLKSGSAVSGIGPEDDDKLQTLVGFLSDPEVKKGKALIFSESETTIDYLYRNLNPDNEKLEIARLSGSNRDNLESIVRRFSPKSNPVSNGRRRGAEIQILLATDVVSEGQNLQDCARVLNYDLHWNPVRLIQRFGRVDRIGAEHSVIHLNNMWPDLAVDEGLELTERLGSRIQMFHDLIGLDSRLLSENERLNQSDMYRIYEDREMPEPDDALDEIAANQHAQILLQGIQQDDPDLWQTITDLPDGIRSALNVEGPTIDVVNDRYVQAPLAVDGAQFPMNGGGGPAPSPFDSPPSRRDARPARRG